MMPANGREFAETAFELIRSNDAHAEDFARWEEGLSENTHRIMSLFIN